MGAKLALVASLCGGSLMAQAPQPSRLAVPPGYRQRTVAPKEQAPPRPTGTINPSADRAPLAGTGGRVMYFHKPANALQPDANDDLIPVEAQVPADPNIVPSVLPDAMSPGDTRLAQAPPQPYAIRPYAATPPVADVASPTMVPGIPTPAAARADEAAPAYFPVSTPAATPTYSSPGMPQVDAAQPQAMMYHTAQKRQDISDKSEREKAEKMRADRVAATRLPARDKIFVIYDDAQLESAIITSVKKDVYKIMQNAPDGAGKMTPGSDELYRFPELARIVPEGTVYQSKTSQYPPRTECYEPAWVVHRRLHFEQKNPERGGWDLGIAQPVVSTLVFYKDVLFWPHSLASSVHTCWDTSAGKCLPGSPTPFYLYPPEITVTGSIAEIGLVTATVFIFP